MFFYVIKSRSLFLINFSLVFTSQTRLILKITSQNKLIKWIVFEVVQKNSQVFHRV